MSYNVLFASSNKNKFDEASKILRNDPDLRQHCLLKSMLEQYWNRFISKTQLN